MQKRINLTKQLYAEIKDKFNISNQSITNALKYHTNSELAQNIRNYAKELLAKEVEEVVIDANDL